MPEWVRHFPELYALTDTSWIEAAARAKEVFLPAGTEFVHEGDACENFVFVIEGAARVYKNFENGREIMLYRMQGGETCSLTTAVLLAGVRYPANAITEADTRAVLIPAKDFYRAFNASKKFRDYVCRVFSGRICDMIMLLEAVTMRNVNVRLARWLLDNCSNDNVVEASHREMANELGTAREVISRHLRDFENQGWVALSRKNIRLVDLDSLAGLVIGIRSPAIPETC